MFEIVVSVASYVGALVLLVKGAIAFCNHSHVSHTEEMDTMVKVVVSLINRKN